MTCPLLAAVALALPALSFPQDPSSDQSAREAAFAREMSGSVLVGHFTMGSGSKAAPQEERYTIQRVTKQRDDLWKFDATVAYGGKSVTVPIVVPVRWAGDTPMIQVTDMNIPMLGRYSARVLLDGDAYAGTWSGGDHGGHMFGRIERVADATAAGTKAIGAGGENWSNWRGPHGNGLADGSPPTEWSEDKNIKWKAAIPGSGTSSPIIWQDRVYVSTAIETDEVVEPPKTETPTPEADEEPRREGRGRRGGRRGGRGFGGPPPSNVYEFVVLAYDRATGEEVWRKVVNRAVPHESGHSTASQASASPITDGEHIFAFFGSRGLYCLDMKGEVQWEAQFGVMRTRNQFGEGSSPALHGDTIVVNWDHEGDSFLVALDKRTGEERWRVDRDEVTSWATPLIVEVDGRAQVIINATTASRGYDLETGDVIWSLDGMTTNTIPTPIYVDGLCYLMSGFRGNMLQAVKVSGAKGDLAGTDHVVWEHTKSTSYVPSGLVYDGLVYFLRTNSAVLSCLDAKTGEVVYEGEKLGGMRTVYASPVGADGRVYITSREGVTKVIKLGREYEVLASNQLDDTIDGTPAIVGDQLFLRGRSHLYCIADE